MKLSTGLGFLKVHWLNNFEETRILFIRYTQKMHSTSYTFRITSIHFLAMMAEQTFLLKIDIADGSTVQLQRGI